MRRPPPLYTDAEFDNLPAVAFALLAAMVGAVRIVFEHGAAPDTVSDAPHPAS
jgi:hypothetical protein